MAVSGDLAKITKPIAEFLCNIPEGIEKDKICNGKCFGCPLEYKGFVGGNRTCLYSELRVWYSQKGNSIYVQNETRQNKHPKDRFQMIAEMIGDVSPSGETSQDTGADEHV